MKKECKIFHRWVTGGMEAADMETFCKDCDRQSTVSAYGYLPLFFDGGIRWEKNSIYHTKEDFRRLPKHIFYNLAKSCKD